jgi:four helix bundle protein
MAGVRQHTDLNVWKLANEIRQRIRPIVDRPGFAAQPKLRSQIEESAERPCPQIAEGFARYRPKDNAKFVRTAAASLNELVDHLERAKARRLITNEEAAILQSLARRTRAAASRYIRYLQTAKAPHLDDVDRKSPDAPSPNAERNPNAER